MSNMSVFSRSIDRLLQNPERLRGHIRTALLRKDAFEALTSDNLSNSGSASSVLFLLGPNCPHNERPAPEPCLILNKRSAKVKQPGDLCCPGGSISPIPDVYLAKLLYLPFFPLARWSNWAALRRRRSREAFQLALLLATGLRESFEEMRLNPLGVKFLGLLPPEQLLMFKRVIYPTVGWIAKQRKFYPNWEVEKVIHIPLRALLAPESYVRFRLEIDLAGAGPRNREIREFPCFIHLENGSYHRLWGATFRITMNFLDRIFGFRPPEMQTLPRVDGKLGEAYLTGNSLPG
jgi:hypothetical protein